MFEGNVTYPFLGRDGKAETLWTNGCNDKMEDKKALKTWHYLYGGLSREGIEVQRLRCMPIIITNGKEYNW
ncbi:uncharacterized protein EAE98_009319 [Botrytis deweyae]|uniref:Uncharacterized protein n=1 Tax=Botrytis deweyae TaxID=2478750 RepID=A0ABQ7IBZ3_9HELO|nr:uncharacterized protein EAE98_009319 [Botrytis deweyae]KAF7919479.1 hypothetical protein EAE98_009319 [Botrytis deweyae]